MPTSSDERRVFAVAPAYERAALTEAGVRSLSRVRGLTGVVIVDHGKKEDGTAARARAAWDRCDVLAASPDLWWTGAVNAGVERALALGATDLLVVNDDQEFDPDFLEHLLATSDAHPEAIVGAKILDASDRRTIVSFGADVDFAAGQVTIGAAGAPDDGRFEHTAETGWLNTQGVLVPAAIWRRIGRLDERAFPHYFGDVHLSYRAREVGARVLVCGRSRTYVDPRTTGLLRPDRPLDLARGLRSFVSRRSWANLRDQAMFAWRHGPPGAFVPFLLRHALRHGRRVLRQAVLRPWAERRAVQLLSAARATGDVPAAVYGSGWDTRWLFDDHPAAVGLVDFLVDDRRAGERHPSGLPVVTRAQAAERGVRTLVVNCAAHEETMFARARALSCQGTKVFRLYGWGRS